MLSLALTSVWKARLLARLLAARVSPIRWRLVIAAVIAAAAGGAVTILPTKLELVEVLVEIPVIAIVYFWLVWTWVFGRTTAACSARCSRRSRSRRVS